MVRPRAGAEAPSSKDEAAMDVYLRSQGLYRKRVAKDGSCLFRAVAEQVLHSQSLHLEVRKSCIKYLRKNRSQFEAFIEGSFDEYLKSLENPQGNSLQPNNPLRDYFQKTMATSTSLEWVGQVEISALSLMFKKEFVVYQEPNVAPARITDNGFSEKIILCFSNGNHYDIIYPIGFVDNAAWCQSIIYELLYEKVFGVSVTKHLSQIRVLGEEEVCNSSASGSDDDDNVAGNNNLNQKFADMNGFKSQENGKLLQSKEGVSVLPVAVLHALNPAVYRNVEYDVWTRSRRGKLFATKESIEGLLPENYGHINKPGTPRKLEVCLDSSGTFYNAHIQELVAENGPAVVFVEELGERHDVPLKNLKPVPLAESSKDAWNTVSARKIRKSSVGGAVVQFEKDNRGQKSSAKPVKAQTTPSLQMQQATGSKQYILPSSQNPSAESKGRSRTPPKMSGRKQDWERREESSYYKRENIHFGLTPEERREKQVLEESKSLYEMQNMDTEAFPALSASTSDTIASGSEMKKNSALSREKNARRKSEEDQRTKAPKPASIMRIEDQKNIKEKENLLVTSEAAVVVHDVPALSTPADQQKSTTVPSQPPAMIVWSESIPAPMPACPGTGSDCTMLHPQVTSLSPLPVPAPAVSQPLLPLSQTLSPYQDPLYPGFPVNEKGERITSPPPYSYCKNGSDLPNDKSILHFFYNLGLKAYTCPMWPPHAYLNPLHQAYFNVCRMYPNIHVYPQNNWMKEVPVNQDEGNPSVYVQQTEIRNNVQASRPVNLCSPVPLTPSVQATEIAGLLSSEPHNLEEKKNLLSEVHEFEGTQTSTMAFSHHPLGQGPYLGPPPVISPLFSQMWYGYPYQGYMESPIVQHNIFIPPQDRSVPISILPGSVTESIVVERAAIQPQELATTCKPDTPSFIATVAVEESDLNTLLVKDQENNRSEVMYQKSSKVSDVPVTRTTILEEKQSKENERNPVTTINQPEDKMRVKEESSEDEPEVSHMFTGRSKNFYNQSYGIGRSRNERFYQPNRGGYQYYRNEEGWRGARGREDGYSHTRSLRGRPSRRRPFREPYRPHNE